MGWSELQIAALVRRRGFEPPRGFPPLAPEASASAVPPPPRDRCSSIEGQPPLEICREAPRLGLDAGPVCGAQRLERGHPYVQPVALHAVLPRAHHTAARQHG